MNLTQPILVNPRISPIREMGAYEALWAQPNTTFKTIAERFRKKPDSLPSELVTISEIKQMLEPVLEKIKRAKILNYGVCVHGSENYPKRLRDAIHPIEVFYFRGWLNLIEAQKCIAIVGTHNPSEELIQRTKLLVKSLVKNDYTVVSGLAKGIDTMVHKTAIDFGGRTVAVIGTPITDCYPPENKEIQDLIAKEHLLISQVPIWRYSQQNSESNHLFFAERNATLSALSHATIIVDADETSDTLSQAKAAIDQKRRLFILDSCFNDPNLTWPRYFEAQGAIRVKDIDDILG